MSPTRIRHRLTGVAAATLVIAAAAPATLASAAPAGAASPSATVSPGTVSPGGRVSLNVDGCGTRSARASSRVFNDVSLAPGSASASNLFGTATVFSDATPGSYPVTFDCGGGRRATVTLQVSPGAARGGLGGSVDSMSRTQIALGGTLAAGALGAGLWLLRRRSAEAR
ncbi:hypothetical protein AB0F18_16980 [Streptomyces sp. NPDC029216]|uniref:hypothetical protein n=1 Tax=Streptomyces sp. NPDC029216 TaxID=3154701 RepID=UPI0033CBBA1F